MENNLSRQACLMGVDVSIFGFMFSMVVFFNAVRVGFERAKQGIFFLGAHSRDFGLDRRVTDAEVVMQLFVDRVNDYAALFECAR